MRSVRDTFAAFAFLALGLAIAAATWQFVTARTFGQSSERWLRARRELLRRDFEGDELSQQEKDRLEHGWRVGADSHDIGLRRIWVKFTLVALDANDAGAVTLASGRTVPLLDGNAELTPAEALELYSQLKERKSFEVVGSASAVTVEYMDALFLFVEDIRYVTKATGQGPPGAYAERETGVKLWVCAAVSDDGAHIVFKKLEPEAALPAGWTKTRETSFGKALIAGWSTETPLTIADGGCVVLTGMDPEVPDNDSPAARRFKGRKGVLFLAAKTLPTIERKTRAPSREEPDRERPDEEDQTDF